MSNSVKQASFNSIDALLRRLATKQASANTEAGSIGGSTSHPIGSVDDSTQDATEGARSAENTADVKHDQGSPAVDSTAPGTPGGQDSVQLNIGTSQKATGEDSSVETASAKPGKEDGGYAGPSSHPARTDNNELDGNKYSAARTVLNSIKEAREAGHQLLAQLSVVNAVDANSVKRAGEAMGGGDAAGKLPPETVSDADSDANNPPPGKGEASKSAADEAVINSIALTVKSAHDDADLVVEYLRSYKAAADEPGPPAGEGPEEGEEPAPSEPSAPPEAIGGPSPDAPAPGPEAGLGGGESPLASMSAEDLIIQLLSSPAGEQLLSGGMGGDPAAGGMGGGPDIGGAEAMGGMMGGAPPLPPAGPAGPAPGGDEAMLAEAMAQEGTNPAELQGKAAAANFKSITGWKPKTAEDINQLNHLRSMVRELVGSR